MQAHAPGWRRHEARGFRGRVHGSMLSATSRPPSQRRTSRERPSPTDPRPDRAALLAFLGVVLFGGVNAVGVRQTVQELAPFWSATVRFAAAGLIMALIVVALGRSFPRGRSLAGAVLYGAIGFTASYKLAIRACATRRGEAGPTRRQGRRSGRPPTRRPRT